MSFTITDSAHCKQVFAYGTGTFDNQLYFKIIPYSSGIVRITGTNQSNGALDIPLPDTFEVWQFGWNGDEVRSMDPFHGSFTLPCNASCVIRYEGKTILELCNRPQWRWGEKTAKCVWSEGQVDAVVCEKLPMGPRRYFELLDGEYPAVTLAHLEALYAAGEDHYLVLRGKESYRDPDADVQLVKGEEQVHVLCVNRTGYNTLVIRYRELL